MTFNINTLNSYLGNKPLTGQTVNQWASANSDTLDANGKELQAFAKYLQGPGDSREPNGPNMFATWDANGDGKLEGGNELGAAFVDYQNPIDSIGSQSQDGGTAGGSSGGNSLEGEEGTAGGSVGGNSLEGEGEEQQKKLDRPESEAERSLRLAEEAKEKAAEERRRREQSTSLTPRP